MSTFINKVTNRLERPAAVLPKTNKQAYKNEFLINSRTNQSFKIALFQNPLVKCTLQEKQLGCSVSLALSVSWC